jgi:uncharacterized membrane protein YedE/YeeE
MNGWLRVLVSIIFVVAVILAIIFNATWQSSRQDGDRNLFIGALVVAIVTGLLLAREVYNAVRKPKIE